MINMMPVFIKRFNLVLPLTILVFVFSFVSALAEDGRGKESWVTFETDTLTIEKADGEMLEYQVELAIEPEQKRRGLMFREELAPNAGMLFIFDAEKKHTFWMKDTLIPLDMIFIDKNGFINHIHHMAKPLDLTHVTSDKDALAVLEVNGGEADRVGIDLGDRVYHETFKNMHLKQ